MSLPVELWIEVLHHLDTYEDIACLMMCCKAAYQAISSLTISNGISIAAPETFKRLAILFTSREFQPKKLSISTLECVLIKDKVYCFEMDREHKELILKCHDIKSRQRIKGYYAITNGFALYGLGISSTGRASAIFDPATNMLVSLANCPGTGLAWWKLGFPKIETGLIPLNSDMWFFSVGHGYALISGISDIVIIVDLNTLQLSRIQVQGSKAMTQKVAISKRANGVYGFVLASEQFLVINIEQRRVEAKFQSEASNFYICAHPKNPQFDAVVLVQNTKVVLYRLGARTLHDFHLPRRAITVALTAQYLLSPDLIGTKSGIVRFKYVIPVYESLDEHEADMMEITISLSTASVLFDHRFLHLKVPFDSVSPFGEVTFNAQLGKYAFIAQSKANNRTDFFLIVADYGCKEVSILPLKGINQPEIRQWLSGLVITGWPTGVQSYGKSSTSKQNKLMLIFN